VNTGKKMDKARKESSMLERKLRMARVRAKNLPKLKAEIRKVAAQLQEGGRLLGLESEHKKWITQTTGNAEKQGLVVTASQYRELGKRRWHRVGYVLPVQHRIRVKGKRDAVWEFMTANIFCPGGGSIREFHMVNGGAGAVAADVQWKGYTCSPRWRKTKRRKR
jgi:hypothetical protein